MGSPSGLAADFNMIGGTAAMRTAFAHTLRAVPADVARDFSAASRVPHHRDVIEIQGLDHGCQIVGIPVHVVSGPSLAGSAMAATIMCDDPETLLREEQHLAVPHIGVQRPSVREAHQPGPCPSPCSRSSSRPWL